MVFQLYDNYEDNVRLFDGVCDQTKELQKLSGSMANDVKWIIYSSGQYMLVRFNVGFDSTFDSTGFLAKIHYGKDILNYCIFIFKILRILLEKFSGLG